MQNARLYESQAGIKSVRRNINNLRYTHNTMLMAESKEEPKNLLMRVKEESEKAGLKLNIQKTKTMTSSPITSWQIDGEKLETETDFIFLGSKITADSDCSRGIKRRLLLGRKAMTNLDSIFKSWDIIVLTKVYIVKAMVFPVVVYGYESWPIRKAECFWTVVLEKTLGSPLDCKEIKPINPKGNQLWIFIGRTDAEAEAPVLWPCDAKSQLIAKAPDAGKDWRQKKEATEDEMVR